jgi:DNA processing protein
VIASAPGPLACEPCLRRMELVGMLAPFIERAATGAAGARSPELLALGDEDLVAALAPARSAELLKRAAEQEPGAIRRRLERAGCWAVCRHEGPYPPQLTEAADAPAALVGRGDTALLGELGRDRVVTVVGSRRASAYGREIAGALAAELAGAGFSVVSGLAWGIDGAAHDGALRTGLTVAVLGCGADVPYPRHHARLYERVLDAGLILSELPPGSRPWRWTFPARNRIMAALGAMTVVVEAAGRSGSLITAEQASELGREVGAVPGAVGARMSAGTNQLIADGARLVRDAQDVLDALIGPGRPRPEIFAPQLEPDLAAVLELVEEGEHDGDAIAVRLGQDGPRVTASLARLELLGYVQRSFAGAYSRTALQRSCPAREGGDYLA